MPTHCTPALTLTDKEYQALRDASLAVLREIGVDTGGSNVQFAVCPDSGRIIIIEMNPRVSRSSALASKATGFPIAKIAAKLAVGYTLDELQNDMTKVTPASFEPSIDYVVTKIPRFAFEKFPGAQSNLTTAMKSVGEVMALGSDFKESFHKALIGLETGLSGADDIEMPGIEGGKIVDASAAAAHLRAPTPTRATAGVAVVPRGRGRRPLPRRAFRGGPFVFLSFGPAHPPAPAAGGGGGGFFGGGGGGGA